MLRYLLSRPIAVIMSFLAATILGIVTFFSLPVSLLPNIDIPLITIRISEPLGARELENSMTGPLRRQLLQTGGLKSIKSESHEGKAIITLNFDYGVDTDLAFIEVNEKIDAAMNSFPSHAKRPIAIKASANDIPLVYLHLTLKDRENGDFLELADVANNIVKRRIEQLPEVSMVDATGISGKVLRIIPDRGKMESIGLSVSDIENTVLANNVQPGSLTVRDGIYEYNINISNQLRSSEDVANLLFRKGDRIFRLGDFCKIQITADNPQGYSFLNSDKSVTLAIIKQGEENINTLENSLSSTIRNLEESYPEIRFTLTRSQTEFLEMTIKNLVQNLILGLILIFIITSIFIGNTKTSAIIGFSIGVSVIITFLIFFIFHISINIISLSGLILAVGMMIDNSVIVTENITRFRQEGFSLHDACDKGTSEIITPMLSSSLTTIAVFIPLTFMSGIGGAIFHDQAFAITAGLAVSYITGIILLPILYEIFFSNDKTDINHKGLYHKWNKRINYEMNSIYTYLFNLIFRHKWILLSIITFSIPICIIIFKEIPIEKMPQIRHTDIVATVEWNDNINIDENARKTMLIQSSLDSTLIEIQSSYVGIQDFLLESGIDLSSSEAQIYIKAYTPSSISEIKHNIETLLKTKFPEANVLFSYSENIFENIFPTDDPEIEARIIPRKSVNIDDIDDLLKIESKISDNQTPLSKKIELLIDREKLQTYNVSYSDILSKLRSAFRSYEVGTLRSYEQYTPIIITEEDKIIKEVLSETLVNNIPLSNFVSARHTHDLKNIIAGSDGEYIPLEFTNVNDPDKLIANIKEAFEGISDWDLDFQGNVFRNKEMINELIVILCISILMMYFILCAQFGDFLQPLIVLAEIPVDTAFALIILWICGESLNLMSAIGIIVTCGVVINDSILKLDAINDLRATGIPLSEAIHIAGIRRLRPIIMTSLTTILAIIPVLFSNDLGSELQRPLAITMIGSMTIGTIVSIFIIPILYWLIYRNKSTKMI